MAPSRRHELLSESACAWAIRYGFSTVAMNTQMAGGPGKADAVAVGVIRGRKRVAVFESKTSRADFKADQKKWHRKPGRGMWSQDVSDHWYVAPSGLIEPDELPDGWGLLVADENGRVSVTVRAEIRQITPESYDRQMCYCAKACAQKYLTAMNCVWSQRWGGLNLSPYAWADARTDTEEE